MPGTSGVYGRSIRVTMLGGWRSPCRAGLAGNAVRYLLAVCGYRVPADSARGRVGGF